MVTVKDVAKLANVPEKTVMRALAGQIMGKRRDARERAERVFAAAEALGYRPSAIASSLRTGRTQTVGLAVGSITNRYYAALSEIVMDECGKAGYHLVLELSRWDLKQTMSCLEHFRRVRTDGIFFASALFPEVQQYLKQLGSVGCPVVVHFDNDCGIASVPLDYSAAISRGIDALKRLGCRSVTLAIWNSFTRHDTAVVGLFREMCAASGMEGRVFMLSSLDDMMKLASERPEAVICDAPYCLKYFYSIKSPDYSPAVVGIYDEWNILDMPQELAGVTVMPSELQIRTAVKRLIAMIEKKEPEETPPLCGEFFTQEKFGMIPEKDFSTRHLFPF